MNNDGTTELTTKRRALVGALIEHLQGLPLDKLELLADAAEYWQWDAQRKEDCAARHVLKFVRRIRAK